MLDPLKRSAAVACGLLLLAACASPEQRKENYVRKGESFMQQRNFVNARLEFRNALQIDPRDTRVLALTAQAAEKSGEYREAARFYYAALKDPANVAARIGIARLLLLGGNQPEAGRLIDEGLALQAEDPGLLALRGALRLRKGDQGAGLQDIQRAIALAPGNVDAAALLASVHARAGDFGAAITVMERALAAQPEDLEVRTVLAQLYLDAGQPDKAEVELKHIIKADPKTLAHRYRLAQFHLLRNDVDAAEATLRAAVAIAPKDVAPKLALAELISSRRSFEQGEASLKQLVAANPDDLPLAIGLGRFYAARSRAAAAREAFEKVVKADEAGPRGLEGRNLLADLALREGRADDAAGLVAKVLEMSPRNQEALVLRAKLAMRRGDASGAIADLRVVLRDQPDAQSLLLALAQAYTANGEESLAEETLRTAVQANPRDTAVRLALAQYLIAHERPDEAQPVVDQLVNELPGDIPALEAAFRVQSARGDAAGARRSALAIKATRPDLPTGHFLLGLVDQADGKLAAARTNLEEAVRLAPELLEPLTALVRTDLALKQPERALERLEQLAARSPQSATVRELQAQVLASAGRHDAATKAAEQAIALAPQAWQSYYTAAQVHLEARHPELAIAIYQRGIAAVPVQQLYTRLAVLQEKLRRSDDAIATYEAWLKHDPRAEVAANNLATLLVTYRSGTRAALDRALVLTAPLQSSRNVAYLDTLGWVRYARGENNEAVSVLQRAVDLAPRLAPVRARLGLAQLKTGQRQAARENLELALKTPGEWIGAREARAALAGLKLAAR